MHERKPRERGSSLISQRNVDTALRPMFRIFLAPQHRVIALAWSCSPELVSKRKRERKRRKMREFPGTFTNRLRVARLSTSSNRAGTEADATRGDTERFVNARVKATCGLERASERKGKKSQEGERTFESGTRQFAADLTRLRRSPSFC